MNEIDVDSYDNDPRRAERLLRVVGYAQALADILNLGRLAEKAASVYDHKGELQVTWFIEPVEMDKQVFKVAWAAIGDGTEEVVHEFSGEDIT